MVEPNYDLVRAQAQLAFLLERDAKYAEAEDLLQQIIDAPMPAEVRHRVAETYARVLRLRNKWLELDDFLDPYLERLKQEGDTEGLAQLLIARMEAYLCGFPNDPQSCIDTADVLMSISSDPELTFRAWGHKGLAALALGDLASARTWLDKCVGVAEQYGDHYAVFLAWHFSSQFSIATLELDSALSIGQRLIRLSEAHALARDELFHLRDLGRAAVLAGLPSEAVVHLASFLLANTKPYDRDRAVTYLVLLVAELAQVNGDEAAVEFLDQLSVELAERSATDPLVDVLQRLQQAVRVGTALRPEDYVDDTAAVEASTRIFFFNCDILDDVRRDGASVKTQAPVAPSAVRPTILVDLHAATAYFRGSFCELSDADLTVLDPAQQQMLRELAGNFDVLVTRGDK